MSNKYKKVYLNGECIIDFTKQTVNEDNVASGNIFFDTEGKLIEGKDDSLAILSGYAGGYEYWNNKSPNFNKLGLRLLQVDQLTPYFSSGLYYGFPGANYWVLSDCLSSIYDLTTDSNYLDSIGGLYLPHQKNASPELYQKITSYAYNNSGRSHVMIYCEDDISEYIPDNIKYCFVFNCSKIKTTEDQLFDYVISNNKVYILNINHIKLNEHAIYDENTNGYNFKFPDIIDNKPVISINGFTFGYNCNCYRNNDSTAFNGSFNKIDLPANLEILGGGCFSSMLHSGSNGLKIYLPSSLKVLLGSNRTESYSPSNSFSYGTFDLSSNIVNGNIIMPDLDYAATGTLYSIFQNGIYYNLPENTTYIATPTNQYAYYANVNSESSNLVIEEGCKYIITTPSSISAITLPSTLKALPDLSYKSSLTNITFADGLSVTEIPSSFCYYSSNSAFTSIVIPEGITTINSEAFAYCKYLNNITLPSTLKTIGSLGFYEGYGVSNLNKVIQVKATTPPTLYNTSSLRSNNDNIAKIIVPQGTLDTYKKASVWSSFASKMEESTEW